jgi:hypothetical protein
MMMISENRKKPAPAIVIDHHSHSPAIEKGVRQVCALARDVPN